MTNGVLTADAQMIVPPRNANRPGTKTQAELGTWPPKMRGGSPNEIVIHETANTAPGADAIMHGHFLAGGGGPERVSFHAGVDALRVVQYLPWDETCYAAGDGGGIGNTDSLNYEFCVNRDADYERTKTRGAIFVARSCFVYDIPTSKIRQHNYRSSYGKDCPHFLRIGDNWARWISSVERILATMTSPKPPASQYFPETGKTVTEPFLSFFNKNGGVPIFGYPIRDPQNVTIWNGATITVQYFERARFENHSSYTQVDPVKLGLVGAELATELGI